MSIHDHRRHGNQAARTGRLPATGPLQRGRKPTVAEVELRVERSFEGLAGGRRALGEDAFLAARSAMEGTGRLPELKREFKRFAGADGELDAGEYVDLMRARAAAADDVRLSVGEALSAREAQALHAGVKPPSTETLAAQRAFNAWLSGLPAELRAEVAARGVDPLDEDAKEGPLTRRALQVRAELEAALTPQPSPAGGAWAATTAAQDQQPGCAPDAGWRPLGGAMPQGKAAEHARATPTPPAPPAPPTDWGVALPAVNGPDSAPASTPEGTTADQVRAALLATTEPAKKGELLGLLARLEPEAIDAASVADLDAAGAAAFYEAVEADGNPTWVTLRRVPADARVALLNTLAGAWLGREPKAMAEIAESLAATHPEAFTPDHARAMGDDGAWAFVTTGSSSWDAMRADTRQALLEQIEGDWVLAPHKREARERFKRSMARS